ncbi:MAG: hypothetical protein H0U69_01005, partial [Trueperaceae bacterium]|nr:hypothetical protein [Trueperaceae bacterium]
MARNEAITVSDAAGTRFEGELLDQQTDGGLTVRDADGRQWTLPRDVIATRDGTTVHLSRAFTDLADPAAATAEERTIPLV